MDQPREPTPFSERVKELAREKGMKISRVRYAVDALNIRGATGETFSSAINRRGYVAREPLLLATAEALGVSPMEFTEYELLMARRLLDPEAVTLPVAYANLGVIMGALRDAGLAPLEQAAQQAAQDAQRTQQPPPERNSGSQGQTPGGPV